jgi:hypothetical protein
VDTASLVRFDVETRGATVAGLDGEVVQAIRDGDALYAPRAHRSSRGGDR